MKRNLAFVGWALAGGALGAVVALLTAPSSGRETRDRLGRRLEDGKQGLMLQGRRAMQGAASLVPGRRVVNG